MADIDIEQLDKYYKQSTDGYVAFEPSTNTATYREVWKSSMTLIMALYKKIQSFKPTEALSFYTYSKFISDIGEDNIHQYYGKPDAPEGKEWTLVNAEVSELDAGDNAELHLTWSISTTEVDPESDPSFDEKWGLTWQSYTVTLYAYCGNIDTTHKESEDDKQMRGKIASRNAIERWFNSEQEKPKDNFLFPNGTMIDEPLNPAEVNIAKKMLQGKTNPVFHYPILTKTETTVVPEKDIDTILDSSSVKGRMKHSDVITDPESKIKVPKVEGTDKDWSWLCQGSNVSISINEKTHNATITITTTYWGNEEWDKNFYGTGSDRWLFGQA